VRVDAVHGVLGCGACWWACECVGAGVGEEVSLLCCDEWREWELTWVTLFWTK
jgi:hypothetical protein